MKVIPPNRKFLWKESYIVSLHVINIAVFKLVLEAKGPAITITAADPEFQKGDSKMVATYVEKTDVIDFTKDGSNFIPLSIKNLWTHP